MGAHAKYAPSSADRWMQCPGSIVLHEPDESSSIYADEGTTAHEVGKLALTDGRGDCSAYLGRVFDCSPVAVDEEMVEFVQVYVDAIRLRESILRKEFGDCQLLVEQQLDFSELVGIPDQFGTGDAILIAGNHMEVHDLKYGKGVRVIAKGNRQLMLYGLAAYHQYAMLADIETLRIVIHQPRLDSIVADNLTVANGITPFAIEVREAIDNCEAAEKSIKKGAPIDGYLNPGDKQCQWCSAKATCPALTAMVYAQVADKFTNLDDGDAEEAAEEAQEMLDNPPATAAEGLSRAMSMLDLIDDWCRAVRAKVESELLSGRAVPGFKIVEGRRGARKWSDEEIAEATMKAARLKQDEMYDFNIISPTVAEQRLKKKPRIWQKLAELITRSDGKPSVAPESDKRPALTFKPPEDAFEDLDGESPNLALTDTVDELL